MKLTKLILLALTIMTVTAFATAATASAEETKPNILPEASAKAPITFTGESLGESELAGGGLEEPVVCTSAPSTGEFTTPKTGLVIIEFLGCHTKTLKAPCSGLEKGEPSEHIKVHAEIELLEGWLVDGSGNIVNHPAVIVFNVLHVHFTCGGIVLVLVLGCVAGLIGEINKLVSQLTFKLLENAKKTKDNDILVVGQLNAKKEGKACELKASINGGKEQLALEVATGDAKAFKQNGKEITVLLMA